jgi:hypothetical protein
VGTERISFIVNGYSGSLLAVPQIEQELEPVHHLGPRPWRLPPVPVDPKASLWPGSGRTLYSMGQKAIRATLEEIAAELNLVSRDGEAGRAGDGGKSGHWWERLLPQRTGGPDVSVPKGS